MESVCVQYLRTRWFVSEILLVRCAHSFDFQCLTNSCVNTVRTHFPWSILYKTPGSIRLLEKDGLESSRFEGFQWPRGDLDFNYMVHGVSEDQALQVNWLAMETALLCGARLSCAPTPVSEKSLQWLLYQNTKRCIEGLAWQASVGSNTYPQRRGNSCG